MNRKTVEKELDRRFGEVLVPRGYTLTKLDKYTEGFVRTGDGIRQSILIPVLDYAPEFQFSLTMCIRLETVETIFLPLSGILPEDSARSETCIVNIEDIVPGLDLISVYDRASIRQAVAQLAPVISSRILPFLDEHRDVGSLDRWMNQEKPFEEVFEIKGGWGWWIWPFVMHAVILARLTQNPDFNQLAERYRNELRNFPKDDRERYEKLVEHLRSLS
jgi:hypothetical protein